MAGLAHEDIKTLGRWQSDSYPLYTGHAVSAAPQFFISPVPYGGKKSRGNDAGFPPGCTELRKSLPGDLIKELESQEMMDEMTKDKYTYLE